jgi:hypothetical protein
MFASDLARTHASEINPPPEDAGSRRCSFTMDELEQWLQGADLEVRELPQGGRVVKPVPT